jgi:superfamily I DNA and/or RNA helicase
VTLRIKPKEPLLIVSCFYRSQVAAVRAALANRVAGTPIQVDTVERNQGATGLIGVLSVADDGAAESRRPLAWRLDPRRLNVAMTRARLKTYILASPDFVTLATGPQNPFQSSRAAWTKLASTAISANGGV